MEAELQMRSGTGNEKRNRKGGNDKPTAKKRRPYFLNNEPTTKKEAPHQLSASFYFTIYFTTIFYPTPHGGR